MSNSQIASSYAEQNKANELEFKERLQDIAVAEIVVSTSLAVVSFIGLYYFSLGGF
jgi:hypothetical protein